MVGSASKKTLTRAELIADIQRVAAKINGKVTRKLYREHGNYGEGQWEGFFQGYSAFYKAAFPETSSPETSTITANSWNIELPKTNIRTLAQLVEHCDIDLSVWSVERLVVNKYEMGSSAGAEALFQVKATLSKRTEAIALRNEIEDIKRELKNAAKPVKALTKPTPLSGNMLEINIPDLHAGKLAWGVETGAGNYDTAIAEGIFKRALETLLDRTKNYKFDSILFVVGNDLFNSDDVEGRTTKGTQVTTDGRYHKTFLKVRRMITDSIERLRQIAPVRVLMVSGNHDNLSVWHLGDSLECRYFGYADVDIENAPTYRKYHQHGLVMLMFTHGNKGSRMDFPLLMATEQPAMFGATAFRECHTGHTHTTKTDEKHGVRVRVLPALCEPDDYHADNAFVGNLRNAEAYVWNDKEGLIAQIFYNDDSQKPIVTKREIVA